MRINLDRIKDPKEKELRARLKKREPFGNKEIYEMKFGPFSYKIVKSKEFPFDSVFGFLSEEDIRQRFYYQEINSGYVVYDIGATAGSYTIQPLMIDASVLAFEPDPRWAEVLEENVDINGLRKHFAIARCALWSNTGLISYEELEDVPCISLDNLREQNSIAGPTYIKLDADGAELEIIKGALRTIKKFRPKMLIEHHAFYKLEQRIDTVLKAFGYTKENGPARDQTSWAFYH